MAIVIVLSVLVLLAALVLAFFSSVTTEVSSSASYAEGQRARLLSDTTLNLVIGQIRDATCSSGTNQSIESWASQPGMIKTFGANGDPVRAFKLYSSPELRVQGAFNPSTDNPPANWASRTAEYVDMNSPVVVREAGTGAKKAYYPILNPSALGNVEGFSIQDEAQWNIDTNGDGTKDIPMPVNWLYILASGSVVKATPDGNGGVTVEGAGAGQSEIVGRVAFWTDDESCKINVNTASEGTFWDTPRANTTGERNLAQAQPVQREWQRYPGHPATISLSPVLAAGKTTLLPEDKDAIYQLVPRVASGGSEGGTVAITPDSKPIEFDNDRLFVTIDELIYKPDRTVQDAELDDNTRLISADIIEQSRFFLTASSRAPEVTLFQTPRISIWPIHELVFDGTKSIQMPIFRYDTLVASSQAAFLPNDSSTRNAADNSKYGSPFDRIIAFASSVGIDNQSKAAERKSPVKGFPFFFQRALADSPDHDINIPRNKKLLEYLQRLTELRAPGFGGRLSEKYGQDDRDQVLLNTFDYVRATNMFDNNLGKQVKLNKSTGQYEAVATDTDLDIRRAAQRSNYDTTEINNNGTRSTQWPSSGEHPPGDNDMYFYTNTYRKERVLSNVTNEEAYRNGGHGQVTPSKWNGKMGIGRMAVLSEIGLLFTCTADPSVDPNSDKDKHYPVAVSSSGGLQNLINSTDPLVAANPSSVQPGEGPLIGTDYRRIQATILTEFFTSGLGVPFYEPKFYVKFIGLQNVEVQDYRGEWVKPFARDTAEEFILTIRGALDKNNVGLHTVGRSWGGSFGDYSRGSSIGWEYGGENASQARPGYAANPLGSRSVLLRNNQGLKFRSLGNVMVEIWSATRRWSATPPGGESRLNDFKTSVAPLYSNAIRFPDASFPDAAVGVAKPSLVTSGVTDATDRKYWWAPGRAQSLYGGARNNYLYGRGDLDKVRNGVVRPENDVLLSMAPRHSDYRHWLAKPSAGTSDWVPLVGYGTTNDPVANARMTAGNSDTNSGMRVEGKLAPVNYPASRRPDMPFADNKPAQTGDWDSPGHPLGVDGAYANMPDEGNTFQAAEGPTKVPYFDSNAQTKGPGLSFFSANRMLPSPVMFGSLPTGIQRDRNWETLLFRPQTGHPNHSANTPDHLLLDLFTLPVVEPYAISEPLSTAGKLNMNYAIAPFSYIKRSTPMIAALKAEKVRAIPNSLVANYRDPAAAPSSQKISLDIDVNETLRAFEERFNNTTGGGAYVFKSATEICGVNLVPTGQTVGGMSSFWDQHALTGDNLRERPYAHLYPKLTTRSNTYTVHVRVQTIKKSKATGSSQFVPGRDPITGEYRGSYLVERNIDPNDPNIEDSASQSQVVSLGPLYRFRVLNSKQFAP